MCSLWRISSLAVLSFTMTGHLHFVILICSFHVIEVQASTEPKLTVSPSQIRETDSITLNCEAPSSVSGSQCSFYTESGKTERELPCLNTMTGSELLEMSHQSSPAQVKVNCRYIPSVYSDFFSITVETPLPPNITMNPPVITETDSVTLDCRPPSSVSVSECSFYTESGGTVREFPCLNTMTGSELLKMSRQSSPAQVKVNCYYSVRAGKSPYSKFSSITIQNTSQKDEINTSLVTAIPSNMSPVDRGYTDPWIWKLVVFVAGCGAAVGVVLLASVLLRNQQRRAKSICTSQVMSSLLSLPLLPPTVHLVLFLKTARSFKIAILTHTTFTPPSLRSRLHRAYTAPSANTEPLIALY